MKKEDIARIKTELMSHVNEIDAKILDNILTDGVLSAEIGGAHV